MVHGLITYHKLGLNYIVLTGLQDDYAFGKDDKVSMMNWNPLLIAIAFKRLDIVRYFL